MEEEMREREKTKPDQMREERKGRGEVRGD